MALAPEGIAVLRGVPLLAMLPRGVIERLARSSTTVCRAAGEAVFTEGQPGDQFFVIEHGSADVAIRGEHIRSLAVGDSFGDIALLREMPRTATVTATSDLTLREIDRDDFVPAVTRDPRARGEADRAMDQFLPVR